MQSHRVLWNVSLSNGENFREGSNPFQEVEGELSPWQQLLAYIAHRGYYITSLWLSCPSGARHHVPSRGTRSTTLNIKPGDDPFLHAFHSGEKPSKLRCFRRQASDPTSPGDPVDHYTIAEATFAKYKVQIFVSEYDPNVSWVLVTPAG